MITLRYLDDFLPELVPLQDVLTVPEVKAFLEKRQIPARVYPELFYLPNLKSWATEKLSTGSMLRLNMACPELVNQSCLPWTRYYPSYSLDPRLYIGPGYSWLAGGFLLSLIRDKSGSLYYIMARSLDLQASINNRYVLISGPEGKRPDPLRVINLQDLTSAEKIYLAEGTLDRFYLPNCAALCGHENLWDTLDELARSEIRPDRVCVILDNEPKQRYLLQMRRALLASGYLVMFWPRKCSAKDLNELAMNGMTEAEIKAFVDKHTVAKSKSAQYHLTSLWLWLSDMMFVPRQKIIHWLKRLRFYSLNPEQIVAKARRHI